MKTNFRANEAITAKRVFVIYNDNVLGEMNRDEGIAKAYDDGLDLVEVDSSKEVPVCKIMDFGKYQYVMKKKQKETRQEAPDTMEIQIGLYTQEHDLQIKAAKIEKTFYHHSDTKVLIVLRMNGREQSRPELAVDKVKQFIKMCRGSVYKEPYVDGRDVKAILVSC